MSEKLIPEHIDPFRFAEQNLSLDGIVNLADMERLRASLNLSSDRVYVDLLFGKDEQGITFLKGHIKTTVSLQCQRCMEPYNYEIISDFLLGIVNTLDEVDELPEHYEPAVATNGELALRDLIEDELILNLPIIPRHEEKECKMKLPLMDAGREEAEKANPFRVLESLKDKRK